MVIHADLLAVAELAVTRDEIMLRCDAHDFRSEEIRSAIQIDEVDPNPNPVTIDEIAPSDKRFKDDSQDEERPKIEAWKP